MAEVLIVGAGLGGLRTAESLRATGFDGRITVVGDEPYLPYSRPPLSKEALAHGIDVSALEFRRKPAVDDVAWRLGSAVASCDLDAGTVALADGAVLAFDGLVVATGIRPRRLPIPGPSSGRSVLRTAADAARVRERLVPGARVLIMGAGFVGCETAATARRLGAEVVVVALDEEPMVRPLGRELGAAMRRHHERHGVRFHLGHSVDAFHGADRVRSVTLSDGSELPADLVIEAVGSVPNVDWLAGNGLDLTDGLLVDSAMQVLTDAAPVVAVGDVARHPNALFGPIPRRVEHWNMPTETGRRAGRTLAALLAGEEPDRGPFAAMPSFWSDQYDLALQSFGMPGLATKVDVVDGDLEGDCIVEYHDASGLVGVVGVNRTSQLVGHRKRLLSR
jgi:3-phenylpropionate/trans-cinnamate dioxygenase ferredoxin reductase component